MDFIKKMSNQLLEKFQLFFPLLICLYPFIYSIYLGSWPWLSLLLIYLFALVNFAIDYDISKKAKPSQAFLALPNIFLEMLNLILILLISVRYSLLVGLFLLITSLLVHIKYAFITYRLAIIGVILTSLAISFGLPLSFFYMSQGFISGQLIRVCVAFILPSFMLEFNRYSRKVNQDQLAIPAFHPNNRQQVIMLSYFISAIAGLFIIMAHTSWYGLILLFAPILTLIWHKKDHNHTMTYFSRKHFFTYTLTFNIVCIIYFILL